MVEEYYPIIPHRCTIYNPSFISRHRTLLRCIVCDKVRGVYDDRTGNITDKLYPYSKDEVMYDEANLALWV